jgi:hypothetical protein
MKKFIIRILVGLLGVFVFSQTGNAQIVFNQNENFDGNSHTFTAHLWEITTDYSLSSSKSVAGYVPNVSGDSIVLTSPSYNLAPYGTGVYVALKFNHICKVSPQDIVRIEYRTGMQRWEPVPVTSYMGKASDYAAKGFSAASYPKWKADDSTAIPGAGWWQEECFDMSFAKGNSIQFRFVLKHGNTTGSQVSYGWLIDDVCVSVSQRPISPPSIGFLGSHPLNTVYRTGPYTVTVEIKPDTATKSFVKPVYLKYTSIYNHVNTPDSVLMNNISGDTVWQGVIPQFGEGTDVVYSVTVKDTNANSSSVYGGYSIRRLISTVSGYVTVGTGRSTHPHTPVGMETYYGWSRQLYLAEEIEPTASAGGLITKLAWECASDIDVTYDRQTCYFQAVADKVLSNRNYEDPLSVGAEQVWTGSIHIKQGWVEITLDKPFLLLPEQNLLVHWFQKNGLYTSAEWYHSVKSGIMCVYSNSDKGFPSNPANPSTDIMMTSLRPNARFYLQGSDYAANSAALLSMTSPVQKSLQIGVPNEMEVLIRNTGSAVLDSVTVSWKVNGDSVQSIQWRGNLSWDNQTKVKLGSFTPGTNATDSILVWLSMPNGMIDSTSWDDTLSVTFYGCSGGLSGSYTVGNGGNFSALDKAMEILERCGASGDIELKLKSGIYTHGLDFMYFGDVMNGRRLTITSEAKKRDSVIFRPASNYGIKFGQTKNITLQYLTFDLMQTKMHGVFFSDSCSHIAINNCAVLCDTSIASQTLSAIYKADKTGSLRHIYIGNNLIVGGYKGIDLYGGTSSQYGVDIVIEGNTVRNANEANIYLYYADSVNILNNTILARPYGTSYNWYGIYGINVNGSVRGNKINQRSASVSNARGIYMDNMNQNNTVGRGVIANNEIILDANKASSATYTGIAVIYPRANILHNSVFIANMGGTTPPRGIRIEYDNAVTEVNLQNNNVALECANGRPVEIPSLTYLNRYHSKSNNFYAQKNMAYIASVAVPNTDVWKSYFPNDITSVSKSPDFADNSVSLKLSNYTDFLCRKVTEVVNDIDSNPRNAITAMGCYTQTPYAVNAMLTEIINWKENPVSGTSSALKIVVLNDGTSTIASGTIKWTFNHTAMTAVSLSKALPAGASDTISLGNISYASGSNEVKAWIDSIGGLTDEYPQNDTLQLFGFVCDSMLNGKYTVGVSGDFKTINEAVHALYTCGINGSVIIALENDTFCETVHLSGNIPGSSVTNTVTFISVNGNASATLVQRTGSADVNNGAVVLKNVSNLVFKQIAIDGRLSGVEDGAFFHALYIDAGCENIEIDSCELTVPFRSDKFLTTEAYSVIYSPTGLIKNIRILNNVINGGAYGVYIRGTSTSVLNKHVSVKNNIIRFVDAYGIYLYYTDSVYIYGNVISQRKVTDLSLTGYSGMYGIYCNTFSGNIIKNRIYADISMNAGIYLSTLNRVGTETPALVANNEIRGYALGSNAGISVNTKVHADIYHNSILINGTGAARGLYVASNSTSANIKMKVKNNLFAMTTSAADFPVYITNTTNISNHSFNYNNYYSQTGTNVGYIGGNKNTYTAWKATMTGDTNSLTSKPYFADASNTLQPASQHGLSCPVLSGIVDDDINHTVRTSSTTKGAYHFTTAVLDVHPDSLHLSANSASVGTPINISLILLNAGTATVDSVDIYCSINGTMTLNPFRYRSTLVSAAATSAINIGAFNPVSGMNSISVWTKIAGGTIDNNTTNDTVKTSIYACDTALNGTYKIGTGGNFATIADALFSLKTCGMNGAVRFEFLPNEIHPASFEVSGISGLSATNTITFTSSSANAANTVLKAKKDLNVMTLNAVSNIKINNLTLNARNGKKGIEMTGAISNIEITNCVILLDTLATTAPVSEPDGKDGIYHYNTGSSNNLRIANNAIDGGNRGIIIWIAGSDRIIDGNVITNSANYGVYCRNGNINSMSYNVIKSKDKNINTAWTGLYFHTVAVDRVEGNQIRTATNKIQTVTGIDVQSSVTGKRNFINNEIFIRSAVGGSGISAAASMRSLYNSVYVESRGAIGLNIKYGDNTLNVSYNNLVAGSKGDVAINVPYASDLTDAVMDYNNYFGLGNIAVLEGQNIASLLNWQTATQKDIHSVSVLPLFVDTNIDLKYSNHSAFYCPVFPEVRKDIKGQIRTTPTIMGAYGLVTKNLDMELTAILNIPPSSAIAVGQTLNPRLIITNTGAVSLDSAKIYWECDGIGHTVSWKNNPLASFENDTVDLGSVSVSHSGQYHLSVCPASVNTVTSDMNALNDTVRMTFHVCDSALSGKYTIGNSGNFSTISEAINSLRICGVSNDVQFVIRNGIYHENINLTGLKPILGNHHLEIVSQSNIADSVIIHPSENKAVILTGNSSNIALTAITIDATESLSYGIELIDKCENIRVSHCRFIADTVSSVNGNQCIYSEANNNHLLSGIAIDNNIICGGFAGIDLNPVKGDSINIHHNLVCNQYASAISLKNIETKNEIKFNVILSRVAHTNNVWKGIAAQNTNIHIDGNKIHQRDTNLQNMIGIELYQHDGMASNNEIIGFAVREAKGIAAGLSKVNLLHNSVYLHGDATQSGIFTSDNSSIVIQKNNIVLNADLGYPITMIERVATTKDVRTNNYCAPNFIGRISSDFNTTNPLYVEYRTLQTWQFDVSSDLNSVRIKPRFVDLSQSLNLADYTGLYCSKTAGVPHDIRDSARTNPTTIGAYGLAVLTDYDLSLKQIISPSNNANALCAPDYVPVKYALCNTGIADYVRDTVYLHLSVKGMKGNFDTVVPVRIDSLPMMETDTFTVLNFLDVSFAGDYEIAARISSEKDTVFANDTLRMTYKTNKIALPYNETFSSSTPNLFIDTVKGTNGWKTVQGSDSVIAPKSGTGMLVLNASAGTVSTIRIGQIELERTAQPKLEFWYEHDNLSPAKRDQIIVRVLWNGGLSEKIVHQIKRYNAGYKNPDWEKYTVDLSPYIDSSCVVVSFEAISYGGVQHIDRITVTSNQNLAIDTILFPPYSLCDLKGKSISLVLANTTNQKVDYATTPTNIVVKISGNISKDTLITLSGTMEGGTKDTFLLVDHLDLKKGSYQVNVYISSPVSDVNRKDDTIKRTVVINPDMKVKFDRISGGISNCLAVGTKIFPTITVENTGNMDISNIGLIVKIDTGETGDPLYFRLEDSASVTIKPNNTHIFQFTNSYIVPWKPVFDVTAIAYLKCDSALLSNKLPVQECTNMNDLVLDTILKPSGNTVDKAGTKMNIEVSLTNKSDIAIFYQVHITALIKDMHGNEQKLTNVIPTVNVLTSVNYTFSSSYEVPYDSAYFITVFIDKQAKDIYQHNDTIHLRRTTDYHVNIHTNGRTPFAMSQNVPNPTKGTARIDYTIPEAGEVIFHLHSISGQLLYSQTIVTESGNHILDINTSHLAAGIYIYSMEYNGQRIVKRMIVD